MVGKLTSWLEGWITINDKYPPLLDCNWWWRFSSYWTWQYHLMFSWRSSPGKRFTIFHWLETAPLFPEGWRPINHDWCTHYDVSCSWKCSIQNAATCVLMGAGHGSNYNLLCSNWNTKRFSPMNPPRKIFGKVESSPLWPMTPETAQEPVSPEGGDHPLSSSSSPSTLHHPFPTCCYCWQKHQCHHTAHLTYFSPLLPRHTLTKQQDLVLPQSNEFWVSWPGNCLLYYDASSHCSKVAGLGSLPTALLRMHHSEEKHTPLAFSLSKVRIIES